MMDSGHEKRLHEARKLWDEAAASFDNEPDHGLRDPQVRAAWMNCLKQWLPPAPAAVVDIGCGTGSLSVVIAGLGYRVVGGDLSPQMLTLAEAKAAQAGLSIQFKVMDAAFPPLAEGQFDALVCRHLLWALPEPGQVLRRWVRLLKPSGRLILIEGFWHTGAGLRVNELAAILPEAVQHYSVEGLSDQPALWGGEVHDERYGLIAYL